MCADTAVPAGKFYTDVQPVSQKNQRHVYNFTWLRACRHILHDDRVFFKKIQISCYGICVVSSRLDFLHWNSTPFSGNRKAFKNFRNKKTSAYLEKFF